MTIDPPPWRIAPVSKPIEYITRIGEKYAALGYGLYGWAHVEEPPPWQPIQKPLSECRLGLIASGGIYIAGQRAFHYKDDVSLRTIPTNVETSNLRATHFAYDLADARNDPNVVFPIDTLRGLVDNGAIGQLADNAYTFMGGIYSARRARDEVGPELARRLVEDHVDVALLVPV
jgi:D-proline reductase (dithiol) PrdB